jgi:hypothetical protein
MGNITGRAVPRNQRRCGAFSDPLDTRYRDLVINGLSEFSAFDVEEEEEEREVNDDEPGLTLADLMEEQNDFLELIEAAHDGTIRFASKPPRISVA